MGRWRVACCVQAYAKANKVQEKTRGYLKDGFFGGNFFTMAHVGWVEALGGTTAKISELDITVVGEKVVFCLG